MDRVIKYHDEVHVIQRQRDNAGYSAEHFPLSVWIWVLLSATYLRLNGDYLRFIRGPIPFVNYFVQLHDTK